MAIGCLTWQLDHQPVDAVNAAMNQGAFITGLTGTVLRDDERDFLRQTRPFATILFARNIGQPAEVVALCAAIRDALQDEQALIFIDQEGGRVQRLRQPFWSSFVAAKWFGLLYGKRPEWGLEGVRLQSRLIADDLTTLGINAVCAPCLDLSIPGAHDIIGDRALSGDPAVIAALGRASMEAYLASGVLPVAKHIPGHGRSLADSHVTLPRVSLDRDGLAASDFLPFAALADCPFAMTAHIIYEAIDGARTATLSPDVISNIIRGDIGFRGALMSDDLGMKALSGSMDGLAADCREAGIDLVLHCSGNMEEMRAVAAGAGRLTGMAQSRCAAAMARLQPPQAFDRRQAEVRLTELLALVGAADAYVAAATPPGRVAHV